MNTLPDVIVEDSFMMFYHVHVTLLYKEYLYTAVHSSTLSFLWFALGHCVVDNTAIVVIILVYGNC